MKYKLPELIKFINKNITKEWKYCEIFMIINGEKIRERLPLGKKVSHGAYINGAIIKKESDKIVFITYTTCGAICEINHKSIHDMDGTILSLSINTFFAGMMERVDRDGKIYLQEYLKSMESKKIVWDIME